MTDFDSASLADEPLLAVYGYGARMSRRWRRKCSASRQRAGIFDARITRSSACPDERTPVQTRECLQWRRSLPSSTLAISER